MEILLSITAIWQLITLLSISNGDRIFSRKYLLLCTSFAIAPFFSYTYPFVIVPVYITIAFYSVDAIKNKQFDRHTILKQWLPLGICILSLATAYISDIIQVVKDNGMHQYWAYLMLTHNSGPTKFFTGFYQLFSEAGNGLMFETIFGIVGIVAFLHTIISFKHVFNKTDRNTDDYLKLYALLVVLLTLIFFAAGRLPIGEPRLNAFTVPAIAILVIYFLNGMRQTPLKIKLRKGTVAILYIGAAGHIFTTFSTQFFKAEYYKKLDIYVSTENAIIMAQEKNLPILITSDIAYPDEKVANFPYTQTAAISMCFPTGYAAINATSHNCTPGDWILKTFPAYKVDRQLPVYAINGMNEAANVIKSLPGTTSAFLVGDGRSFRIINR